MVSVIIPFYNRKATIIRAINSVFNQTYQDFELILINDGSTDDGLNLLDQVKKSFRLINQSNLGVSAARNAGIELAKYEWIAFLDSDDEWLPDKLEKQVQFISENPELKWVHGEEFWIRNGKRVNPMKKHQKGGGDQFLASLDLCLISPSTVMLKKSLLEQVGGFREDFPVCEDYDLWLKLTSLYPIGFIENPLIKKYGGHADQLSRKYKAMDYYRVKSIDWILHNRQLSPLQKKRALHVLKQKCEVLIQGYRKHENLADLPEVQKIYQSYFS